jgi:hypothetical protein
MNGHAFRVVAVATKGLWGQQKLQHLPMCSCMGTLAHPWHTSKHRTHMQLLVSVVFIGQHGACCGSLSFVYNCMLFACLQLSSPKGFAWQHEVQKTDTLPALAVRYMCDVTSLKRMNNMITEHSLHSRHIVYVPGKHGQRCFETLHSINYVAVCTMLCCACWAALVS